jgi:hypothetical protein
MEQWWKRHSNNKMIGDKTIGDFERSEVEDVTGCIPLLLDKCVVDGRIDLTSRYLRDIYNKAVAFVQEIYAATKETPGRWEW